MFVRQGTANAREKVMNDKTFDYLIAARGKLHKAWMTCLEGEYAPDLELMREIDAAYNAVTVLIDKRIATRKVPTHLR